MSNSQLNKSKSGIKNDTEKTLKVSSNIVGDSNDETNFPHKFLLTNTQFSKLCEAFASRSLANIKLSKTQLHKIGQLERLLGRLFGPLQKTGLLLMKHVLKPLPLELIAAASATNAVIQKKKLENDVKKIANSLEQSGLLIKGISETIKNEAKQQKGGYLGMFLGTLGVSLIGNLLKVKEQKTYKKTKIYMNQKYQNKYL